MKPSRSFSRCVACLWVAAGCSTAGGLAQSAPAERTFNASKSEVESALQSFQVHAGGRLPTLDGFVDPQTQSLRLYQRPHYGYSIQVFPKPPDGCRVQVKARVTAWLADPNPSRAGYRELPSNGRLETDLFERLEDWLAQKSGAIPQTSEVAPATAKLAPLKPSPLPSKLLFTTPRPGAAMLPPRASDSTPQPPSGSASYVRSLSEQAKNLEEILRNQTHPTDLAAVKQSRTPVYSRPSEEAQVLFLAEAQDEFQVLNTSIEWVHVQISGLSRGWIRGPALELPSHAPKAAPSATVAPSTSPTSVGQAFRLTRQEVGAYPGDWAPLRGKSVRIMSLEPTATGPSTASQKWESAKAMFQRAAARLAVQDSPAASAVEGVVLIFDSADGGMASATVTSLQEWYARRLSDDAFRAQCSFDPPEAFKNSEP